MSDTTPQVPDVIIVGAGLAGLSAAYHLQQRGKKVKVLEAADRPGGRIRTDKVEGFLLDRGFQVLLTEYPETKELLNYEELQLRSFLPGAMVLNDEGMFEMMDPARVPGAVFKTLGARVGSLGDKFRMLRLKNRLKAMALEDIFRQPEISTLAAIQNYGFSEKMLRNFFQPFMAGIFLENGLTTSRREFDFVFKMFSSGNTSIPEKGMEMIPQQLAGKLQENTIVCHKEVKSIQEQKVVTKEGEEWTAPVILLATNPTQLVSQYLSGDQKKTDYRSTTNVYLTTEQSPITKPIIALNARGSRLVNNLCVLNEVATSYAPEGKSLISVSINGKQDHSDEELTELIKEELSRWFGKQTSEWQHLRTYRIDYALPNQDRVEHELAPEKIKLKEGLYATGDYWLNGSINAALRAGRMAAQAISSEMVSA